MHNNYCSRSESRLTADKLASMLPKAKRSGNGWAALCPAHNDHRPSLSFCDSPDGKLLLTCHAGCRFEDIIKALPPGSWGSLAFSASSGEVARPKHRRKIVGRFVFRDAQGNPLYEQIRFEPKSFARRRLVDGQFVYNWSDVSKVPFNLPDLLHSNGPVFFAEGPGKAELLKELGVVATCSKHWQPNFSPYIQGREAIILTDHDAPGLEIAEEVAGELANFANGIKIVDLYGDLALSEKRGADVVDWVAEQTELGDSREGLTARLLSICESAPEWSAKDSRDASDANVTTLDESFEVPEHPEPAADLLHGLAGEFVRIVVPHSEAHPMALLVQFLVYYGNLIGRSAHFRVEGDRHFTNLYAVLVGPTGGRKGTAFGRVKQVFEGLDILHESECVVSGLSSGEGLTFALRDEMPVRPLDKGKGGSRHLTSDGASDKRILVVEGEFAQVLMAGGRDGSTLKSSLRNYWDTGRGGTLTRTAPLRATNAHVSLIGHITAEELMSLADKGSLADGTFNRTLWVAVKRSPELLPFGGNLTESDIAELKQKLSRAIEFARNASELRMTNSARELWGEAYPKLELGRYGLLGKLTQRASPLTLRLALIYALLDEQSAIDVVHLKAALAVWQYCEESAKFVFGDRFGDPKCDRLIDVLKRSPKGLSKSQIRDLFDRNISAQELNRILTVLASNSIVRSEKVRLNGAKKPTELWHMSLPSTASARQEVPP